MFEEDFSKELQDSSKYETKRNLREIRCQIKNLN